MRDTDEEEMEYEDNSTDLDVRDAVIKQVWDRNFDNDNNDSLLFGTPQSNIDLHTLHPDQVQIFRLWQIYLDNVNPLLKVTHTPTLQPRVIDGAANVANIDSSLEALMFSIYCVSILSLSDEECHTMFGTEKAIALASYQFACRHALQNCEFLRSGNRDCLTALFLYLISARPGTDPRSLSSMLAVAIRIAHRMGIHNEASNAKCASVEAEMRRRLWWSVVMFDNRVCEMFDYKTATLAPTWDCKLPLNINDSELRTEMKNPPVTLHDNLPTESIFIVLRSEVADFTRHSAFHLDFTNPSLKTIHLPKDTEHRRIREDSYDELIALESTIEKRYLTYCNPENPLHFMTIYSIRSALAKCQLLEHYYNQYSLSSSKQNPEEEDISYALIMLESDTKLMSVPLAKGYIWYTIFHFPLPAYIHILQGLRKQPMMAGAGHAWEVMSTNLQIRTNVKRENRPLFVFFARMVLQTWRAREALWMEQGTPIEQQTVPWMVEDIRNKVAQMRINFPHTDDNNSANEQPGTSMSIDDFLMPMDISGGQISFTAGSSWSYPDMPVQAAMQIDMNQLDWTTIDWNTFRGW
ncbi:hypothetical protein H072_10164 [Dactylellina haptotyla CBS 200.50]|uniref:Xylanolytic transcriptional activator regulatory domain-containing protein n=1 Tax=Dactylellina haptotyla (strain CBS 200.50) TaxID=1284197 RepID=S8A5H9_DACHA|nr:hypothetical protein H072_10164 [Dactylellina haptotyla CBS 200.50]